MRRMHLPKVLVAIFLVVGLLVPSAATALSPSTTIKLWIGNASMSVNGVQQLIDVQGTIPVIVAGRTLVPIRAVIEAFGGSTAWDATSRKVTVTLGKDSLDLWIDKSQASLNGTALAIDSANPAVVPVITNGRTMLPLRFVAESLGINVEYDTTSKMITLTYTGGTTPAVLAAPLLVSPANDAWSTLTPTLSWAAVPGATKYEVSIWFVLSAPTHLIDEVVTATSYTVPSGVLSSGLRYAWTVVAGNNIGWSAQLTIPGSTYPPTFMTRAATLAAPLLVSPANDAVLSALTPTLSWTAVPGATNYGVFIWVASDTTLSNLIDEVVTATSYTVPSGVLTTGVRYAWTVVPGNNNISSGTALTLPGSTDVPAFWFDNKLAAPAAPHLVSPATEVILSTMTPTLSWTAVPGATKYEVHIWVASATPPPYVVDEVLATTSYTIPSGVLTASVQYAWTVYAGNSLGWSASLTAPGSTYVPVFMVQAAFQAPSPGVIETQINGKFTGWDGDTIFELTNGQIWQQDSYAYTYHYAYRPKVLIYYVGGRYKMTVEGVDGFIYVTRLK